MGDIVQDMLDGLHYRYYGGPKTYYANISTRIMNYAYGAFGTHSLGIQPIGSDISRSMVDLPVMSSLDDQKTHPTAI